MTNETELEYAFPDTQTVSGIQVDDLESLATRNAKIKFWYAIQIHSRAEDRVCNRLVEKGLFVYVPTCKPPGTQRDVRLLPGYVLIHMQATAEDFTLVRNTPHVLSILGAGNMPISIPDSEIQAVRLAAAQRTATPCSAICGEWVEVRTGPMAGVEGRVMRVHGELRLVVEVSMLGRGVAVTIDRADVVVRTRNGNRPNKHVFLVGEGKR